MADKTLNEFPENTSPALTDIFAMVQSASLKQATLGDILATAIGIKQSGNELQLYNGQDEKGLTINEDQTVLVENLLYVKNGKIILGTAYATSPGIRSNSDNLEIYNGQNELVAVFKTDQSFYVESQIYLGQALAGGAGTSGMVVWGDGSTDGNWRIVESGGVLLWQKRVSGAWVNTCYATGDQDFVVDDKIYSKEGVLILGESATGTRIAKNGDTVEIYNGQNELCAKFDTSQNIISSNYVYATNGIFVLGTTTSTNPYLRESGGNIEVYHDSSTRILTTYSDGLRIYGAGPDYTSIGVTSAGTFQIINYNPGDKLQFYGRNTADDSSIKVLELDPEGTSTIYADGSTVFAVDSTGNAVAEGKVYAKGNQFVLGSTATEARIIRSGDGVLIYNGEGELVATFDANQSMTVQQNVQANNNLIAEGAYLYLGNTTTDGSWRITQSGDDLVFQQRESGTWNTKSTISGA